MTNELVFMGKTSDNIMNSDTMSDDEEVASDVSPALRGTCFFREISRLFFIRASEGKKICSYLKQKWLQSEFTSQHKQFKFFSAMLDQYRQSFFIVSDHCTVGPSVRQPSGS